MLLKETNNAPFVGYRKDVYLRSNQDRGVIEGLIEPVARMGLFDKLIHNHHKLIT